MDIIFNGITFTPIPKNNNYYISKSGEVYSSHKGALLKQNECGQYKHVSLCGDGKVKYRRVHRLVAETFIDNPLKKPCVNHINCDKFDNRVENLEWVTPQENSTHALTNRLCQLGSKHHNSKLKENDVRLIRFLKGKMSHSDIGYCFNISTSVISSILVNRAWGHLA